MSFQGNVNQLATSIAGNLAESKLIKGQEEIKGNQAKLTKFEEARTAADIARLEGESKKLNAEQKNLKERMGDMKDVYKDIPNIGPKILFSSESSSSNTSSASKTNSEKTNAAMDELKLRYKQISAARSAINEQKRILVGAAVNTIKKPGDK